MNTDHSDKRILARGCDPAASSYASKAFPPLLGNPEYVPSTNDDDFIEKLKSQKWSVVYFAPGACRFSAAKRAIPGSIEKTNGWSLDHYKALVYQYQGPDVMIVETVYEKESLPLLKKALDESNVSIKSLNIK
ncbi:MAG: hypothetical protein RIA62_02520 [Cyclobacteriaceae bacterium]